MARKMKDIDSEEANVPPSVPSAGGGIGSRSNMGKQGVDLPLSSVEARWGRRFSLPLRHEQEQEQARTGERGRDSLHFASARWGDFPPSSYCH